MPEPGTDCDIVLYHQQVQNGSPQGYLLDRSRLARGAINVFRSAYKQADGDYQDQQTITFTLLLADDLIRPDGSPESRPASEMYSTLFALLNQRADIGLVTHDGVFSGLYSSGNYALEERAAGAYRITIQLSSNGNIFAPADRERYEQSYWVAEEYSGEMTWNNSYWRA